MTITLISTGTLIDFTGHESKTVTFKNQPSIKDIIESAGIPHVEIGSLVRNGLPVDFNDKPVNNSLYLLIPADWKTPGSAGDLQPPYPSNFGFVLDVHLGRLARELRLLGLDVKYENHYTDNDIIDITYGEERFVLTRDLGLLKHGSVRYGHWMRHTQPEEQVREVLATFNVENDIRPFSRCLVCNTPLLPVDKQTVNKVLPPRVKMNYMQFNQCPGCGRVYWKGSHYKRMLERLDKKYQIRPS